MVEMLEFAFLQRALAASLLVGTSCAVIGVYVILRGLSFIGDGIAHAAFTGVALGFLVGWNPMAVAVLFCLGLAGSIHGVSRAGGLRMDTAIGVFYSLTMALGILFIGLRRTYDARLYGYLFGSILTVTPQDLAAMAGLTVLVGATVVLLYKEFEFLSYDPEMAEALGLPTRALSLAMLLLMSLTIVLSLEAVGVMLVFALIVTPAAAAYQLTYRLPRMFALSILFGNGACLTGLVLSYLFDLPSGSTIVLTASAIFFACLLFSPKRRRSRP